MGPVEENTWERTSGIVTENEDGTYNVPVLPLGAPVMEVGRFENGVLRDVDGSLYAIVDNGDRFLTVHLSGNADPPMSTIRMCLLRSTSRTTS